MLHHRALGQQDLVATAIGGPCEQVIDRVPICAQGALAAVRSPQPTHPQVAGLGDQRKLRPPAGPEGRR